MMKKNKGNYDMFAPHSFEDLTKQIEVCHRCALPKPCIGWDNQGSMSAEIMFIGEALGAQEVKRARPFVGRAGKEFDKCLAFAALARNEVYVSNVVKARPTAGDQNRTPHGREVQACLPHVQAEIQLLKPRVVVLLGGTASNALLGLERITQVRGTPKTVGNVVYLPAYHPSYVMRSLNFGSGKKIRTEFLNDLILAKRLAEVGYFGGLIVGRETINLWESRKTAKYIGLVSESTARDLLMGRTWKLVKKVIDGYVLNGEKVVSPGKTVSLITNSKASTYAVVRTLLQPDK